MERAEAEAVYDAGREACVEFLVELTARYERQVTRLEARIERLEEKLRENSQNSSRPPSADPPAKRPHPSVRPAPASRAASPGHEGTTRKLVAESELEEIVDHWPGRCSDCGCDLDPSVHEPAAEPHRHQVTELPPIAVKVIEHRAHSLRCPDCGHSTRAGGPEGIGPSAFGPRVQAAIALLSVRNRISRRDASELCGELFGQHADRERLAREIAPIQRRLRALLEPHEVKSTRSRRFRTFARNLLKLWPALWTFTEIEGSSRPTTAPSAVFVPR